MRGNEKVQSCPGSWARLALSGCASQLASHWVNRVPVQVAAKRSEPKMPTAARSRVSTAGEPNGPVVTQCVSLRHLQALKDIALAPVLQHLCQSLGSLLQSLERGYERDGASRSSIRREHLSLAQNFNGKIRTNEANSDAVNGEGAAGAARGGRKKEAVAITDD